MLRTVTGRASRSLTHTAAFSAPRFACSPSTSVAVPMRSLSSPDTTPPISGPPPAQVRMLSSSVLRRVIDEPKSFSDVHFGSKGPDDGAKDGDHDVTEHAVISTFDLFSIGIGPSSSHTVGPLRAGNIFVSDLIDVGLLPQVNQLKIALYGSLAATGEGHMTPQALLAGLEGADCETIEPERVPLRYQEILDTRQLCLGKFLDSGGKNIVFDYKRDLVWHWGQTLPLHSNGMRMTAFDAEGNMLATNDFYSVGGGFVVNGALSTAASSSKADPQAEQVARVADIPAAHPADLGENLFYKEIRRSDGHQDRRSGFEPRVSEHISDKPEIEWPLPPSSADTPVAPVTSVADPGTENSKNESSSPPYPFHDGQSLLALTKKHNMTIAQIVYENERHWYTDEEIQSKLFRIWEVMDECIRTGVHASETNLPGSLRLRRRAPGLYKRLMRGFYVDELSSGTSPLSLPSGPTGPALPALSGVAAKSAGAALSNKDQKRELQLRAAASFRPSPPKVIGSFSHPILPVPPRKTVFPAMDFLSTYAIAVNEVNAAGGRIVTSPTNGAAGVIPAVLRYLLAFISEDPHRDICTFLLTASAIGMLFKRGATISAAEGGCMAEVGVACSMAAAAFAACMGASPHVVEQAAEIGIEHNLGLTCDPVEGLVQIPCIERNGMGAVKAVTAAQLALANADGEHAVTLDAAIHAMRMTARDMHTTYKETSLAGLARTVRVPVAVPDC